MSVEREAQVSESRLLLRWAAGDLNATERAAMESIALDIPERQMAARLGVSRSAIWMAQKTALAKMRRRLEAARVRGTSDLLSA